MKKRFFAAALLAISSVASAVGQFDGIYAHPTLSTRYASIHQSGDSLIVAMFDTTTVNPILFSSPGGVVRATRFDYWDLYRGAIAGNVATLSGQTAFGNCELTFVVTFSSTAASFNASGMSNTQMGNGNSTNCPGISSGGNITFQKIF